MGNGNVVLERENSLACLCHSRQLAFEIQTPNLHFFLPYSYICQNTACFILFFRSVRISEISEIKKYANGDASSRSRRINFMADTYFFRILLCKILLYFHENCDIIVYTSKNSMRVFHKFLRATSSCLFQLSSLFSRYT